MAAQLVLPLIGPGSKNEPMIGIFKPSRSSSSQMQGELEIGGEIKMVSTAFEFLDGINVSATIGGKDFRDKISKQQSPPRKSHAQPV